MTTAALALCVLCLAIIALASIHATWSLKRIARHVEHLSVQWYNPLRAFNRLTLTPIDHDGQTRSSHRTEIAVNQPGAPTLTIDDGVVRVEGRFPQVHTGEGWMVETVQFYLHSTKHDAVIPFATSVALDKQEMEAKEIIEFESIRFNVPGHVRN